ncbi:MAG: toxin [Acidobacteriia bacterium]|nr:toxin [Terriglobia bacterium]
MEFIEAPAFTRRLSGYLNDDDYRELQARLGANPELGNLMPGTGGFRKMRWADVRRGKSRRGGLRIIYYHFPSDHQIWLMTLYDKNEAADLTTEQKKALKASIEKELAERAINRVSRPRRRRRLQ